MLFQKESMLPQKPLAKEAFTIFFAPLLVISLFSMDDTRYFGPSLLDRRSTPNNQMLQALRRYKGLFPSLPRLLLSAKLGNCYAPKRQRYELFSALKNQRFRHYFLLVAPLNYRMPSVIFIIEEFDEDMRDISPLMLLFTPRPDAD